MATSTLGSGTLVLAGTTSGTTTVTATAVAGTTTLTLPAATDTLVGKATTDTLTNKTLTGAAMNGTLGATTPSTVAATTISATGAITPSQTAGIVGTTTNNNADAGSVGEVVSSSVAVGSAVSLTNATGAFTGKTITSISLTAGDWDVYGIVGINNAATTNFTAVAGGISTTNDTLNSVYEEETRFSYGASGLVLNNVVSFSFPTTRVSISATTTYYLIGYASFSVSTATAFGRITARRRR
jgi:hypothetical protein